MKKQYSREIADAVSVFLRDNDWKFIFQEDVGVFRMTMDLQGKIRSVQFIIDVHDTSLNVYGIIPVFADDLDDGLMWRASRFLHMANFGLRNGNFELDFRDGELRYKTFVGCRGLDAPSAEMLREGIFCVAAMVDRYGEGIIRILLPTWSRRQLLFSARDPAA